MLDKFLIAPLDSGLTLDKKPWAIMDSAFTELRNAYAWRGRIVKRFGSELSGRGTGQGAFSSIDQGLYSKGAIDLSAFTAIGYGIGFTDSTGGFSVTLPSGAGFRIGQYFTIGITTYTVTSLGTPTTLTATGGGTVASTKTLNTTTGALVFAAALANVQITFYPYINYPYTGVTDGFGYVTGKVPGKKFNVGQQFSIGEIVFTVVTADIGGVAQQMLRTDNSAEVATFSTVTGTYAITIVALPLTSVFYYPTDTIMGFSQFEQVPVNNEPAFAFDTQFAYKFNGYRWLYSGPGPITYFHGTDAQFFWSCNYHGVAPGETIMIVSNFNATPGTPSPTDDPMWYYDGTQWNIFAPISIPGGPTGGQKTIVQAKLILPYKNHLHLMDTIEQVTTISGGVTTYNNTRYQSRDRFSWIGSPIGGSAKAGYPFYEYGQLGYSGGGWVDAGTQEAINSAEYLKDRLDIGFERSTYELTYTGNETEPFQWNKLNTELGCESPFATVPFDKAIFSIGVSGITACNGMNVERIDQDIPDYIFGANNNSSGTYRIQGIRDYKTEMVYWSLPVQDKTKWSYFPNTVLVYNYKNNSWATNDDCITSWGYFEQSTDKTWADMNIPWYKCNFAWNSYLTLAKDRLILIGNQQGYISILNPTLTSNSNSILITNFVYDPTTLISTLTIMNHTLRPGDFIDLQDLTGVVLDPSDQGIHQVITVTDANTITLNDVLVTSGGDPKAPYLGGGSCSRVSRISMKTKQWNFYLKEGRNFLVNKIDFLVARSSGALKIEQMPNSTSINLGQAAQGTGTSLGNYPFSISLGALSQSMNFNLGTTDSTGYFTTTVSSRVGFIVGQYFTVGGTVYTVTSLGSPATLTTSVGGIGTATLDTGTGVLIIIGGPALTDVVFTTIGPSVYMESDQDRIWRTIFPQADANFIQLRIYLDDWMMKQPACAYSTVEINAIMLSCKPTGQILEDFNATY